MVVIVGVDVVSHVRARMNDVRDLALAPRPEHAGVWLVFERYLRVDLAQRLAVTPRLRFLADGVVDGVDHAPDFVDVPHEEVVAVLVVVVLDDGFGQLLRWECAPIARRRRERRQRAVLEDVGVPTHDILDLVGRAVAARNEVADLRDILASVRWEHYGS